MGKAHSKNAEETSMAWRENGEMGWRESQEQVLQSYRPSPLFLAYSTAKSSWTTSPDMRENVGVYLNEGLIQNALEETAKCDLTLGFGCMERIISMFAVQEVDER